MFYSYQSRIQCTLFPSKTTWCLSWGHVRNREVKNSTNWWDWSTQKSSNSWRASPGSHGDAFVSLPIVFQSAWTSLVIKNSTEASSSQQSPQPIPSQWNASKFSSTLLACVYCDYGYVLIIWEWQFGVSIPSSLWVPLWSDGRS